MQRRTAAWPTWARMAVVVLTLSTLRALAEETLLEVIPLRYRAVEEVIPVLRPLLPPTATLSGMNSKLIVRATPANLAEIRQLLATLDTAPRRLVISVRQDADMELTRRGGQVSGRVEAGDSTSVRAPGSPTPAGAGVRVEGVRAKIYGSQDQRTDRLSQQVQVLEGGRALIRVGQSVPVPISQVVETPDGRRVVRSAEFRDLDTGFYVVPRISGDQVTLEISTAADTLESRKSGGANIRRVQTVVSGPLGKWIEIAGIGQQAMQHEDDLLARSTDAQRDHHRVQLRVEEVR